MKQILLPVEQPNMSFILGHARENAARSVVFDLAPWEAEYGEGNAVLLVQRSGDSAPYPVPVDVEDGRAVWTVSDTDTAKPGWGQCEVQYLCGPARVKSAVWRFYVSEALAEPDGAPEPYETLLERIEALTARAAESVP